MPKELSLLVKTSASPTAQGFAGPGGKLKLESPLFSDGGSRRRGAGVAPGARWYSAKFTDATENPWDACHALVAGDLGIAPGSVELAEPDLEQQWLWDGGVGDRMLGVGGCDVVEAQDSDVYAVYEDGASFDDRAHSELRSAREAVANGKGVVRIAHLDTGYDPEHLSVPANVRTDLERNYVDAERPNDARDDRSGLVRVNYGHGTATLALLAGRWPNGEPLGAAANLEVVPIRVANMVVVFRNQSIVRAIDHVLEQWANAGNRIHVVTMSMGGVASAAWAEAVNRLYERGIFMVSAAGNNFRNLPTRFTVFPARFERVVAAAGVMADGHPYADLPARKMAGCYGPKKKRATSIAAYTPNVPWARIACKSVIDGDGNGTSAATPQVAAAAALWMARYADRLERYPEGWMRVEAVRTALFEAARKAPDDAKHFGQGCLRARAALDVSPARANQLVKQPEDSASFALIRGLAGLGVAPGPRERMLELEALQLSQRSAEIEELLEDLDLDAAALASSPRRMRVLDALADSPSASSALKKAIAGTLPASVAVPSTPGPRRRAAAPTGLSPVEAGATRPPLAPPSRPLRVYAFDPAAGMELDTLAVNQACIEVPWEELEPGPVGEYLEVVDVDPSSGAAYPPVDLNHPHVLAQRGLEPEDGSPQFHQQMVYAVAMRTIQHFERALGRRAQWAERGSRGTGSGERFEWRFVRRLRMYPHALREANAYYSPDRRAILFGYFNASRDDPGNQLPGGLVFTCLSHDIVAHEVVHALLDGLHPRFKEPTNPDMEAFHEAFADIVALFQHFSLPEALRHQIGAARGDLRMAPLLGGLAAQFGQAIGHRGALRSYIATYDEETKQWVRREPSRDDYANATEAHARGAVLVAAVFDAFLEIFRRETEDLVRLATGGTGKLPEGALPHDLTERLAKEAARIASRVLAICIRALDYCPPFDLTFGEYIRALVTADRDVVPDDAKDYRVAFVSAFRRRGIYPTEVGNLSVGGLLWQPPDIELTAVQEALQTISGDDWTLHSNRYRSYLAANAAARVLHAALLKTDAATLRSLGLHSTQKDQQVVLNGVKGKLSRLEVHSVRPARRVTPGGEVRRQTIIEITQRWKPLGSDERHRGGCTLVCDAEERNVLYAIRKRIDHPGRMAAQQAYAERRAFATSEANYFDVRRSEPFALIHRAGGTRGY